ncbi:MAG: creatininase family protein [Mariniphaga sp.]
MRSYILNETNWKGVKQTDFQVAVLPWGATEAHNYHLPYGTDNIIAERIAAKAAALATNLGGRVIVLPAIPFGVNTGQPDVKLDMNLNPGTQMMILRDLITVLNRQGIHKMVILNAHGGNDFRQIIRELNLIFPEMFLCQCNWFKIPGAEDYFSDLGEHAGEVETSFMMYLAPELVLPLAEAGDGKARIFAIPALNQGWAWAEREWTRVTNDTGIGNPALATAEKGESFFNVVTEKIGGFLYELAVLNPADFYKDKLC